MDTFSIEIPPDADFHDAFVSLLSSDSSIKFEESQLVDLMESEGSLPDILTCIIAFPAAAMLNSALKHLSPVILEFIKKNHQVKIKIDKIEIQVANANDLKKAITAANDLSKVVARKQSPQSKK
ncbi:MAG: hypothetical protein HY268_09165 [Deltaproteobacteria bacterium]|nr:hypothetical protein [Deltaproteobacteria bacterium]